MRELIERLEKATGPSFDLDEAIWCALNPGHDTFNYNGDPRWRPYTQSIDAALTLVPKGCQWTLEPDAAWVRWLTEKDVDEAQGHFLRREGTCTAIALCVAALKARSAEMAS